MTFSKRKIINKCDKIKNNLALVGGGWISFFNNWTFFAYVMYVNNSHLNLLSYLNKNYKSIASTSGSSWWINSVISKNSILNKVKYNSIDDIKRAMLFFLDTIETTKFGPTNVSNNNQLDSYLKNKLADPTNINVISQTIAQILDPNYSQLKFIQILNKLIGAENIWLNNFHWIINNTLLLQGKSIDKDIYKIKSTNDQISEMAILPLPLKIKNNQQVKTILNYNNYNLLYNDKILLNNRRLIDTFKSYIKKNNAADGPSSAALGGFNSGNEKFRLNLYKLFLSENKDFKLLDNFLYSPTFSCNIPINNLNKTYAVIDGAYNDDSSICSLISDIIKERRASGEDIYKKIKIKCLINSEAPYNLVNKNPKTIQDYIKNWGPPSNINSCLYNILGNKTETNISFINIFILEAKQISSISKNINQNWIQRLNIEAISKSNTLFEIIAGIQVDLEVIVLGLPGLNFMDPINDKNKKFYKELIENFDKLYSQVL